MDKQEIVDLFEKKVGPNPSHEELVEHVRRQEKAIHYLLSALGKQAGSLLTIRDQMVDHKSAIESLANCIGAEPDDGSAIILPEPPELVGFKTN